MSAGHSAVRGAFGGVTGADARLEPMSGICEGRVCVITGAGRGIGREYALMLAEQGAKVVVNDLGGDRTGEGVDATPAQEVVAEIEAMGGEAVANGADVADYEAAGAMIQQAIDAFGRLDVVVNNAGILRDRMLVNMAEEEWDSVITVHLKGTYAPTRHAAAHWRELAKAGEAVDARIINTTSPSGIYGNPGQTNYGAAKAGIAAFTVIAAMELERYGVTVNAIAPGALTRMTEDLGMGQLDEETKASMHPRWIAPIVTWLASPESAGVTGRVFQVSGRELAVAEGWHRGPSTTPTDDLTEMGAKIAELMAGARPNADMSGRDRKQEN
jgi:NAD(P)-dependent dehydrogenase (short-subunit alcohol dehydrogenase family)